MSSVDSVDVSEVAPCMGTLVQRGDELSTRYSMLVDCFRACQIAGRENLVAAWTMWQQVRSGRPASDFWLSASLDGQEVFAAWSDSRLIAHRALEERARLLIRLGETFRSPETGPSVPAGLDEPVQAALTLIRAADQVLAFSLRVDELVMDYRAEFTVAS